MYSNAGKRFGSTILFSMKQAGVDPKVVGRTCAGATFIGCCQGGIEKIQSRFVSNVVGSSATVSYTIAAIGASNATANATATATVPVTGAKTVLKRLFASSSSSSSSKSFLTSFVDWYEHHLSTAPVLTKMITGSILWGLGDAVAQIIPQITPKSIGNTSTDSTEVVSIGAGTPKPFTYDVMRTARASFFGFAIHAPTSHVHYNFLEYITVRGGFTGYSIPIFKAFMEQFVYWSWISNSIYHGSMEVLQTLEFNPTKIYNRIYDVLWETQKAQWVFWIPIQLINFQYTPVRHQLNVVLITSIVWTALLSAWYPPKPQSVEEQKEATQK